MCFYWVVMSEVSPQCVSPETVCVLRIRDTVCVLRDSETVLLFLLDVLHHWLTADEVSLWKHWCLLLSTGGGLSEGECEEDSVSGRRLSCVLRIQRLKQQQLVCRAALTGPCCWEAEWRQCSRRIRGGELLWDQLSHSVQSTVLPVCSSGCDTASSVDLLLLCPLTQCLQTHSRSSTSSTLWFIHIFWTQTHSADYFCSQRHDCRSTLFPGKHGENMQTPHMKTLSEPVFKPGTFWLWGDSANHRAGPKSCPSLVFILMKNVFIEMTQNQQNI